MEVMYELTDDDVVALHRYFAERTPAARHMHRRATRSAALLYVVLAAVSAVYSASKANSLSHGVAMVGLAIVFWCVLYLFSRFVLPRFMGSSGDPGTAAERVVRASLRAGKLKYDRLPTTARIEADGWLSLTNADTEGRIRIRSLEDVHVTDRLLILVRNEQPVAYMPLRAFDQHTLSAFNAALLSAPRTPAITGA